MVALSVDDAKRHLNITTAAHDAEVAAIIAAAEAAISHHVGPLEPTTVTKRVFGRDGLMLPVVPVISVTSVTPYNGTALTVADLYADPDTGIVSYLSGASFGNGAYTVVYEAGRTILPDDLALAVKELVRHLWDSQRGPTRRPGSPASDGASNSMPGAGYLLPFRVQELIAPHMQIAIA